MRMGNIEDSKASYIEAVRLDTTYEDRRDELQKIYESMNQQ